MKYLVLVLLLGVSTVIAAPTWHTSTIETIYPLSDGSFVVIFAEDSPSCTNANEPNYHYVTVGQNGVTAEGVKNLLAVALSAATLGSPITINFDSDSSACYINRLLLRFE